MPCSNISAHSRRNRLEDDKRHKEERDGFVEIIRFGTDVSSEAYVLLVNSAWRVRCCGGIP
jgi:hypothetical protein